MVTKKRKNQTIVCHEREKKKKAKIHFGLSKSGFTINLAFEI